MSSSKNPYQQIAEDPNALANLFQEGVYVPMEGKAEQKAESTTKPEERVNTKSTTEDPKTFKPSESPTEPQGTSDPSQVIYIKPSDTLIIINDPANKEMNPSSKKFLQKYCWQLVCRWKKSVWSILPKWKRLAGRKLKPNHNANNSSSLVFHLNAWVCQQICPPINWSLLKAFPFWCPQISPYWKMTLIRKNSFGVPLKNYSKFKTIGSYYPPKLSYHHGNHFCDTEY